MIAPSAPASRVALALLAAVSAPLAAPAHDAPGEYFFNTDPGAGLATPLPFTEAPDSLAEIESLTLPLPSTAGAVPLLGLRFRNPNGDWGPTTLRRVHLVAGQTPASVGLAWGAGVTEYFTVPPSGLLELLRPASALGDADRLQVRLRSGDFFGPAQARRVSPFGGFAPTRLYHALNQRPDPATAAYVELTEEMRLAPQSVPLDLGAIAPGYHVLHLRLEDGGGLRTDSQRFLHVMPSRVQTLVGLAYTFWPAGGEAPGAGSWSVAPISVSGEPQDITLTVPAALPAGAYSLALELVDAGANPGAGAAASVTLGSTYEIWALSALAGRDPADTQALADPDRDQLVNLLEFAFGLDPLVAETQAPYSVNVDTPPGGEPFFVIEYRQREGGVGEVAVGYVADGLRYRVEASTDLARWSSYPELDGASAHVSRHSNGDGTETVRVELYFDQALQESGRVFVRLGVATVATP